jgi:hypothetical protein
MVVLSTYFQMRNHFSHFVSGHVVCSVRLMCLIAVCLFDESLGPVFGMSLMCLMRLIDVA